MRGERQAQLEALFFSHFATGDHVLRIARTHVLPLSKSMSVLAFTS